MREVRPNDRTARAAAPVALLLFLVLAGAVGLGFSSGEGLGTAIGAMLEDPWGRATLVDLYVGFALFAMWIVHRERSWRAAPWIIATALLGNLVPCVYVVVAAIGARGNATRFWHGAPAQP